MQPGTCGLPAAQQVSWDSSFCQELEADGCQDIMSEVTQTTQGFSLAGTPSATARNSLWGNVRKGSGALHTRVRCQWCPREHHRSQHQTWPQPQPWPCLGRWQCKVLAGGKQSWGSSAPSSPSQNRAGEPLDGHWTRHWRRGQWDTGSCQVVGLCRRIWAAPVAWLMPLFQWMDGTPAVLMYEMEHEPTSWWGNSTIPPGYFTLNTAKGWVLPLYFHSAALKEWVIGLPLIWQMGVQSKPCISSEVRFEAVCWVLFMWIAVFDCVTLCHVRRDLFTPVGLIGSVRRAHCYRVGETGAGMYRSYRNPANVVFDLKTKLNLMFQIWRTVFIQL